MLYSGPTIVLLHIYRKCKIQMFQYQYDEMSADEMTFVMSRGK